MSTQIDQKAYLQKYLKGPSSDKKKKKKKSFKGKGLTIIDADVDVTKLRTLDGDELDFLGEGEDAPQIAGIIDERPEEIRKMEQFNTTTKWRVINQDDGFNSKLQIQEIKKDVKEVRKENEIVFGKMYSDSEDEKNNDSDLSPPRKNQEKTIKKSSKHNSDSDFSPPRKKKSDKQTKNNDSDSDLSPPRKSQKGESSKSKAVRKNYDSDQSPPRRRDAEKSRKPSRWGQWETDDRNQKKNNDSDNSSPRNSKHSQRDQSPVRKSRYAEKYDSKTERRKQTNPEKAPQRRPKTDKQNGSDSDLSPPRKKSGQSSVNRRNNNDRYEKKTRRSCSPPPSNSRIARTLEGKVAGLQDAKQLRQENEDFRRREDEAFKNLGDEVSGRNAKAVSRKGKREDSEERRKQKDKAERQKVIDEKYKKWSAGLKQIEDKEARYRDFLHEASKPLARHEGDTDLENSLKKIERDGDPMLKYMREKKRERGELGPERPMYKGDFPPNRFNIRPGHRWDGVDRSNGYEKKYFQNQSKRRAHEEEAYKWSTEDL